ncbi:MAG: Fic family protein [Bacilli bacterium]|nr:Fic family protein [Bacilli bacterium]
MDKLVSNIRNIQIYDNSMFHLEDVLKKYEEYLDILKQLEPNKLKYFIRHLKNREIINNQEAEMEESFLLELFKLSQRKDSIDITMKYFEDDNLTVDEVKKIHRVVIKGSSDDLESNYDLRSDNNKWVGAYGTNGQKRVDYMPPDYNEINELLTEVLSYLNEQDNTNFINIFIKPLIAHAAIAYLQPFGNGNTRLARVLQHCKICNSTNKLFGTEFTHPTIYLSKNYLLTRAQYRGLITNIAVNKDDGAWNKWFDYNLTMFDDQLYFLNNQLDQYRKIR